MRSAQYFPLFLVLAACGGDKDTPSGDKSPTTDTDTVSCIDACQSTPAADVDYLDQIGCFEDFELIASDPLDASIPGARSVKTVIDRLQDGKLHFQNSKKYMIHWEFAFNNLSAAQGLPPVPELGTFNLTEYYSPDRRFLLGAITYYEEPDVWAYEVAPYDTADADMITQAFRSIRDNTYFCNELFFHPSSLQGEAVLPSLPEDVPVVTSDELFENITYQPLNLAESTGFLQFRTSDEVDGKYTYFREIVILDKVPNDISIVAGIVTEEFQTPLSHINVLSQNRGTPNMSLKGAFDDPDLRALEGKWVRMVVGAFDYTIEEITAEEAEAWWVANKPDPLDAGEMDLSIQTLVDDVDMMDFDDMGQDTDGNGTVSLAEAIQAKIPAFGGKATHFGAMSLIGDQDGDGADDVPMPPGYVIPVYFYNEFMEYNGLWDHYDNVLLQDQQFLDDPVYRQTKLEELEEMIRDAPLQPGFEQIVIDKMNNTPEFAGRRMRFRSSTNAEDLGDFTGAGLYTSKSGDPNDPDRLVADAIRGVYASVWGPRAYEEREFYGINHRNVGMALLSHRSFPEEEANGVAITGNIFDQSGLEPAFFVNVQAGGDSVVLPDPGVFTDQFIYYFSQVGSPITFVGHSNLIPADETVLTVQQTYELGKALDAIHRYFLPVYGLDDPFFYAMDTEFKFDDDGSGDDNWQLYMKQARKFPSWEAAN